MLQSFHFAAEVLKTDLTMLHKTSFTLAHHLLLREGRHEASRPSLQQDGPDEIKLAIPPGALEVAYICLCITNGIGSLDLIDRVVRECGFDFSGVGDGDFNLRTIR